MSLKTGHRRSRQEIYLRLFRNHKDLVPLSSGCARTLEHFLPQENFQGKFLRYWSQKNSPGTYLRFCSILRGQGSLGLGWLERPRYSLPQKNAKNVTDATDSSTNIQGIFYLVCSCSHAYSTSPSSWSQRTQQYRLQNNPETCNQRTVFRTLIVRRISHAIKRKSTGT